MEFTINQRIRIIANELFGGNISEFARQIGVSQPSLRDVVGSKQVNPGYETLKSIVENSTINIDGNWLLTGQGSMRKNDVEDYDDEYVLHYTSADGLIGILGDMFHKFSITKNSKDIKERRLGFHPELRNNKEKCSDKFKWISFFRKKKYKNDDYLDKREAIWQPKMFDLYADLHRGGCIEYNKAKLLELNAGLNMKFSDVFYQKYLNSSPKNTAKEELTYKNYSYNDERECRLIYYGGEEGISINHENCISKIYLGCSFFDNPGKVSELCKIIEEKNIHPQKIVEIEVKGLDRLMPDHIGQIYDPLNIPHKRTLLGKELPIKKIVEYLSLNYRKKYGDYIRTDIPHKIVEIRDDYRDKYYTLLESHNELQEKHIKTLEELRLRDEEKNVNAGADSDVSAAPRTSGMRG